jgi:hypothetical protein
MDDDGFDTSLHVSHEMNNFLNHSNSIRPNIQFTVGKEEDGHLLLLVLVIYIVIMGLWDTNPLKTQTPAN